MTRPVSFRKSMGKTDPKKKVFQNRKLRWPTWFPYPTSWLRAFFLASFLAALALTFNLTDFWNLILLAFADIPSQMLFVRSLLVLLPVLLFSYLHHFFWFRLRSKPPRYPWPRLWPSPRSLWEGFYGLLIVISIFFAGIFLLFPFGFKNLSSAEEEIITYIIGVVLFIAIAYFYQIETLLRRSLKRRQKSIQIRDRVEFIEEISPPSEEENERFEPTQIPEKYPLVGNKVPASLLMILVGLMGYLLGKWSYLQEAINFCAIAPPTNSLLNQSRQSSPNQRPDPSASASRAAASVGAGGNHSVGLAPLPPLPNPAQTSFPTSVYTPLPVPFPPADFMPVPLKPEAATASDRAQPFQAAIKFAITAANLTQFAQSKNDWELVIDYWQGAIDWMRLVPKSSPQYELAQKKVKEYRSNLAYAKKKSAQAVF